MALDAAAGATGRPRPALTVLRGRRGVPTMVTIRQSVLDDLRDELTAAGQEMEALGHRVEMAVVADRPDLVMHVAGRLVTLGVAYRQRGQEPIA